MRKFNTALPFTTCTHKTTKEVFYIQDGEMYSQADVNKNHKHAPEEAVPDSEPNVTKKIPVEDLDPEQTVADNPEEIVMKHVLADVSVVNTEKHDNIVADPSQTEGADEVKLYASRGSAKATITRNKWNHDDYDILPYQNKFVIQKKAE